MREAAEGIVIADLVVSRLFDVKGVEAIHLVKLLEQVASRTINKEMDIKISTINHLRNEMCSPKLKSKVDTLFLPLSLFKTFMAF